MPKSQSQEQPPSADSASLLHPIPLAFSVLSTYLKIGKKKKGISEVSAMSAFRMGEVVCKLNSLMVGNTGEWHEPPGSPLRGSCHMLWQLVPSSVSLWGPQVWLVMLSQHGVPPPPQHCDYSFTPHITLVHTQKQTQKSAQRKKSN